MKLPMFKRLMIAVAAVVAIVGCNRHGDEPIYPDLHLVVGANDITDTSVTIVVSHSGDSSARWYGFITDDITTPTMELIEERLAEGMDSSEIHRGRNYVGVIRNLTPETTYNYVAVALTNDSAVYGDVAVVEFTTLAAGSGKEDDGMVYNNSWRVSYSAKGSVDGSICDNVVRVDSADDNSYMITVVSAEDYELQNMRAIADALLADMYDYLEYFNSTNNTNYGIDAMLYRGNGATSFELTPGRYRALAIGISPHGEVSDLYAVSEEFAVAEQEASEAYNAWLGDWTIEGANGATASITLAKGVANTNFIMTGWEGIENLPVVVEYDAELDAILFISQLVVRNYDLGAQYGLADIYFYGGDKSGYFYDNSEGDYYIAIGGRGDDGTRSIVRYGVSMPGYPAFAQMFYMAEVDGEYYTFSSEEEIPSFTSMMSPRAEVSAAPIYRRVLELR